MFNYSNIAYLDGEVTYPEKLNIGKLNKEILNIEDNDGEITEIYVYDEDGEEGIYISTPVETYTLPFEDYVLGGSKFDDFEDEDLDEVDDDDDIFEDDFED